MFAVERLRMRRIETAVLRRLRIVEPETDMERIRRRQPTDFSSPDRDSRASLNCPGGCAGVIPLVTHVARVHYTGRSLM